MFKDTLKTIALSLAILSLIGVAYAWTEPAFTPPDGNTSTPVNVSIASQIKSGSLQINGFRNLGNTILDGNVGIGTTSPGYKLDVAGDIRAQNAWLRTTGNTGWYSDSYGGGWFMQDPAWLRTYNSKSVWTESGLLGSQGGLTIGYGGAGSPWSGAIIAGNVGIGTTSPGAKLEVAGNIIASAPTASNHVATKGYVDALASAPVWAYRQCNGLGVNGGCTLTCPTGTTIQAWKTINTGGGNSSLGGLDNKGDNSNGNTSCTLGASSCSASAFFGVTIGAVCAK